MVIGVKGDEAEDSEDPEDPEEIYFNMYGDKVYIVRVDQAFLVSQFAKSVCHECQAANWPESPQ